MSMYTRLALRNLLQAKRRSFLLGFALAMVTALLVILLSVSQGITDTMVHSATSLSAGHVNVAGFYKVSDSNVAAIVTDVARLRKIVTENLEDLDFLIDRQRGWGRVISDQSSMQAGLNGIDLKEEGRLLSTLRMAKESEYLEGGRDQALGDPTTLARRNQALLFVTQAKRLRVTVGDAVQVTTETFGGQRNTVELTVAAIAQDMGMLSGSTVFVNKETVRDLYQAQPDSAGAVMVYLKDIDRAPQAMKELREVLAKEGFAMMEHDPQPFWMKFDRVLGEDWVGQRMDLTTWRDEVVFLTWILAGFDFISIFLIAILLFIIAVGITNAMAMSVRERTSEIGTVRAIGMRRRQVLLMFLVEALMLGFIAACVGAATGALISSAIHAAHIPVPSEAVQMVLMSDTLRMVVKPQQLIGAIVGFTIITGLAALIPAVRASKLQPVAAIQHAH